MYTKDFYQRNGVSTWKLFMLPWTQLPLWITISFALRNISGWVPPERKFSVHDFQYIKDGREEFN